MATDRVLLIADSQRHLQAALEQAAPGLQVTAVASYFDAIAELSAGSFTTVLASAEPIERRPEPALRTVRRLAREARLVLFANPALEPLSRRMLDSGCDDYLITPANPSDLQRALAKPRLRLAPVEDMPLPAEVHAELATGQGGLPEIGELALTDAILRALQEQPHRAAEDAARRISALLGAPFTLVYQRPTAPAPETLQGQALLTQVVRLEEQEAGLLHLLLPIDHDASAPRRLLSRLAESIARVQGLQDRHNQLQKLAITDDLTGLYNARYFRHFLSRVLDKARSMFFPVTLLIFDIDEFKKYNDQFGHGVGDEILRQTATMIRKCVREHDLVARLGGDEFAVVFWEKDGPRQARDPQHAGTSKPPQTPELVFERFKRMLAGSQFKLLGAGGQGRLTISAGLAVFPYHASTMEALIEVADKRLMFGAKRAGKNSIFLVGGEEIPPT